MPSLRRDIIVTLIIKFSLLYGLWYVSFSHPVKHQIQTKELALRLTDEEKSISSLSLKET